MSSSKIPTDVPENWVCVGRVQDAQGLKGELRVHSYTDDPKHIGAYGPLHLVGCEDVVTVLKVRHVKNQIVVIRAKEIEDRDTAELLKGHHLYVDRSHLPVIKEEDTFYARDLEGLSVHNPKGDVLGKTIAIHNFGAGDILEIHLEGHKESVMIPFLKEWVHDIDASQNSLVIDDVYLREYLKPFKPSDERWDEASGGSNSSPTKSKKSKKSKTESE